MYELRSRRYKLIECKVNQQANNQQFTFEQQPLLQSITGGQQVFVEAIKCYASNAVAASPITPGNTMANAADIQGATLTLNVLGTLRFQNVPLAELNTIWSNDTSYVPFNMAGILFCNVWAIDWTQSYVTTTIAVHAQPLSFMFGVYYEYNADIVADDQLMKVAMANQANQ